MCKHQHFYDFTTIKNYSANQNCANIQKTKNHYYMTKVNLYTCGSAFFSALAFFDNNMNGIWHFSVFLLFLLFFVILI